MNKQISRRATAKLAAIMALVALAATGCSSTTSMVGTGADRSSAKIYPITAEQADHVLATAMASVFPDSPISRVEMPNKGYQATIHFMLDSHTFVAYEIAAKGRRPDGSIVDGYYYEVNASGTMPIHGKTRTNSLFERLNADAASIASPIPLAGM